MKKSHRFLAASLLLAGSLFPATYAGAAPHRKKPGMSHGRVQARVRLLLDKKQYFLGENIVVHYCLENTGKQPFSVDHGSDYTGRLRSTRFKVTATDEAGQRVPDPDPGEHNGGGIGGVTEVRPGEKFWQSLSLPRYLWFERSGVYRLRIWHDLGWGSRKDRTIPVGETTLRVVMPTAEQALQVVEAMYRLPAGGHSQGMKERPWQDFSALGYPVYLPLLLKRAQSADPDALTGLSSIATPEATQALIDLLRHPNRKFALQAAYWLQSRLPDWESPQAGAPPLPEDRSSRLVRLAWRQELIPSARAAGRYLLATGETETVSLGASILRSIGNAEDVTLFPAALDRELRLTLTRPREEAIYPPPRGATHELLHAAEILIKRGGGATARPTSPGEIALFLTALRVRPDSRPPGWREQSAQFLEHPIPYLRQLTLESIPPTELPTEIRVRLGSLLRDPDLDIRIAALRLIEEARVTELREEVLRLARTTRDHWEINAVNNAAVSIGATYESMRLWAERIDESGMAPEALHHLSGVLDHSEIIGWGSDDAAAQRDAAALKSRWLRFLDRHEERLRADQRFQLGDPAITPDLFPGMSFHRKNKPSWPPPAVTRGKKER